MVVGCGEGVVYLKSLGCPTDIGLQWARPVILVAGKGCGLGVEGGGDIYYFCFFTFIPVPLSFLSLSFISSSIFFVSFLWEMTQNDPQGLTCR